MTKRLVYRPMRAGEEAAVIDLIVGVFKETVAPLYSREGIEAFSTYAARPAELRRRIAAGGFVLVAVRGNDLVGMIEVQNCSHVSLLFVATQCAGEGIGRELLRRTIDECRHRRPEVREITVNSSPNSVSFYQHMGFRPLGDEMVRDGIRFTPMSLRVAEWKGKERGQ